MYIQHEFLSFIQALEIYHRQTHDGKHVTRMSLRDRLTEICAKCNNSIDLLSPNDGEFIGDVVSTRNFLTHYSTNNESRAKAEIELYNLAKKTKLLLEICFLIELGIPDEKIKILVSRNRICQQSINL